MILIVRSVCRRGQYLIVLTKAAGMIEPGKRPLHNPALGKLPKCRENHRKSGPVLQRSSAGPLFDGRVQSACRFAVAGIRSFARYPKVVGARQHTRHFPLFGCRRTGDHAKGTHFLSVVPDVFTARQIYTDFTG